MPADDIEIERLREINKTVICISALTDEGIEDLRQEIIRSAPESWLESSPILRDLIEPGEMAILVVPIDIEAPAGRILLPQSQAIRDVLDNGSCAL